MLNPFRATVTHACAPRALPFREVSFTARNLDRNFDSAGNLSFDLRARAQEARVRTHLAAESRAMLERSSRVPSVTPLGSFIRCSADSPRFECDRAKGFGSGRSLFRASFDAAGSANAASSGMTGNRAPRISRLLLSGITTIYSVDYSASDSPARGESLSVKVNSTF